MAKRSKPINFAAIAAEQEHDTSMTPIIKQEEINMLESINEGISPGRASPQSIRSAAHPRSPRTQYRNPSYYNERRRAHHSRSPSVDRHRPREFRRSNVPYRMTIPEVNARINRTSFHGGISDSEEEGELPMSAVLGLSGPIRPHHSFKMRDPLEVYKINGNTVNAFLEWVRLPGTSNGPIELFHGIEDDRLNHNVAKPKYITFIKKLTNESQCDIIQIADFPTRIYLIDGAFYQIPDLYHESASIAIPHEIIEGKSESLHVKCLNNETLPLRENVSVLRIMLQAALAEQTSDTRDTLTDQRLFQLVNTHSSMVPLAQDILSAKNDVVSKYLPYLKRAEDMTGAYKAHRGLIPIFATSIVIYQCYQHDVVDANKRRSKEQPALLIEKLFPEMPSLKLYSYIIFYEAVRDVYHHDLKRAEELFNYPVFTLKRSEDEWMRIISQLDMFYLRVLLAQARQYAFKEKEFLKDMNTQAAVLSSTITKYQPSGPFDINKRTIVNLSQCGEYLKGPEANRALAPIPYKDGVIDMAFHWIGKCARVDKRSQLRIMDTGQVIIDDDIFRNEPIRYRYAQKLFYIDRFKVPYEPFMEVSEIRQREERKVEVTTQQRVDDIYYYAKEILDDFYARPELYNKLDFNEFRHRFRNARNHEERMFVYKEIVDAIDNLTRFRQRKYTNIQAETAQQIRAGRFF
jgi:hypothetical protein